MCAWDTTEANVDAFVADLKSVLLIPLGPTSD